MENLVKLDENKKPVVSTFDLFPKMGYATHMDLKRVINEHKSDFDDYGLLRLESRKPQKGSKGGRPEESYYLNEDQFVLLAILAKNTQKSVDLKIRVSKEFSRMRSELATIHQPTPETYLTQVRQILLLDAPAEWIKLFPDDFYRALMGLYGKEFTGNSSTPTYCANITRRWIYDVVMPKELNQELDMKRKEEKKHQWYKDKGRELLYRQIISVTGIAKQSRNRAEFEARCASMFNNEPFQLMLFL